MRYKLLLPGLVVVAGVLSLLLVLHHFDANQASTTHLPQTEGPGAHVQAPQDNVAVDDVTSSCDGNAPGMADPAAVYCHELGYEYQVVDGAEGQYGVCDFPDGGSCDAWRFLEGTCGQGYSYCAKQGYGLTTKTDGKNALSSEYGVCVQGQQEIGSATELMHLSEKATRGSFHADQSPVPPAEGPSTEAEVPSAPASFDWRSYNGQNWMTYVKDQGTCGSCWAFSAVGIAESVYNISTNNPNLDLDLSEEYLVSDCLSGHNCCGGSNSAALNFIRDSGVPDEACLPYLDGNGCDCFPSGNCPSTCAHSGSGICSNAACSNRCVDWSSRLTRIQATGPVAANVSSIQDKLVEKGPLSACVGVGDDYGGYFDANNVYRCTTDVGANHCVVIAGYSDASGYWIAKNSWGPSWNGDGYVKIGYGECSIENYVYYAEAPAATPTRTPTVTRTATPTRTATRTATPTPTRGADTDGDGCTDVEEQSMGFNPLVWYDFYDVPVPANTDPTPNGTKNRAVNLLDVLAVLKYVPSPPPGGTLDTPNVNGVAYNAIKGSCDPNGDTVPENEGLCYDHTTSPAPNPPWDAGPPDGAISLLDVIAALKQYGLDCSNP